MTTVDELPQRPCPILTWPGAWCPGRADIEDPIHESDVRAWQAWTAGPPTSPAQTVAGDQVLQPRPRPAAPPGCLPRGRRGDLRD